MRLYSYSLNVESRHQTAEYGRTLQTEREYKETMEIRATPRERLETLSQSKVSYANVSVCM